MNDRELATAFKIPAEMPFLQAICWQVTNVKNLTFPECYVATNQAGIIIDLAIQRLASPIPQEAIDKAEAAYQVMQPLNRAIQYFQKRPDDREKCYDILSIAEPDRVIDGIDLLAQDLGREITVRTFSETIPPFPGSFS